MRLYAKKVAAFRDTDGLLEAVFSSVRSASKITKIGTKIISDCCNLKRETTSRGYIFRFVHRNRIELSSEDIGKIKLKEYTKFLEDILESENYDE